MKCSELFFSRGQETEVSRRRSGQADDFDSKALSGLLLVNAKSKLWVPLPLADDFFGHCCSSWAHVKEALSLSMTSGLRGT